MFWAALAIGASVLQTTGFSATGQAEAAQDSAYLLDNDAAILAAHTEARSELPTFLKIVRSGPAHWQGVALKVALPTGSDSYAHVWITEFTRINGTRYEGVLGNVAGGLTNLRAGDRVAFTDDQIDDFGFVEDGMGYGFYSTRAMLPLLSDAQTASYRRFLSPDPLPSYW